MRSVLFSTVVLMLSGALPAGAETPYFRVTVDSVPPGAKVYVDGKQEGMACQAGPNCKPRVSKGTHRLLLELDGYKPVEESINVSGNQRFVFTMHAAGGRLEIRPASGSTSAQGAELLIDGKLSGLVPGEVEVSPGRHTIEVKRPGYSLYTQEIEIKAQESRVLMVSLVENPAPLPPPVAYLPPPPAAPQQAVAPAEPPRRSAGASVSFVPRDGNTRYIVSTSSGGSCSTPCTVLMNPGHGMIGVTGPGSKHFEREIIVPSGASQVSVQHFTLSRVIAGPILTAIGLPLLAVGSYYMYWYGRGYSEANAYLGGVTGAHGLAFTIAGLVQLGSIKTTRVDLRPLVPVMTPAPNPQSEDYPQ